MGKVTMAYGAPKKYPDPYAKMFGKPTKIPFEIVVEDLLKLYGFNHVKFLKNGEDKFKCFDYIEGGFDENSDA